MNRLETAQYILAEFVKKDRPGFIPSDAKAQRVEFGKQAFEATIWTDAQKKIPVSGGFAADLKKAKP